MNVLFSSTLPNAFDGGTQGEAKLLQIAQGDPAPVVVLGTVTWSETTPEEFDTRTSLIEKWVQTL